MPNIYQLKNIREKRSPFSQEHKGHEGREHILFTIAFPAPETVPDMWETTINIY